jgi:hypothetical protein
VQGAAGGKLFTPPTLTPSFAQVAAKFVPVTVTVLPLGWILGLTELMFGVGHAMAKVKDC